MVFIGKIIKIFIALVLIIIGMIIAKPSKSNINYILESELSIFEQQISDPNNQFQSPTNNAITPGITNKVGGKIDDIITSSSNYLIILISKMLNRDQ